MEQSVTFFSPLKLSVLFLHVVKRRQTILLEFWKRRSFRRRQNWSESPRLL